MKTIPVKSPSGLVYAKVDDGDYEHLIGLAWHLAGGKGSKGKYAAVSMPLNSKSTTVYMHRWVAQRMGLVERLVGNDGGRWKNSVDHVNGDKLDNRRENLRLRDRSQQMLNSRDVLRSTNKSGYRGVSYVKSRERFGKPWMAYVTVNYKTKNLGWYTTVEEAAEARRQWDTQQDGMHRHLGIPY